MDFTGITYGFDLPIMKVLQGSDSLFLDRAVFTMTQAGTWVPLYVVLLVLVIRNNETTKQIALLLLFAILSVVCCDVIIDSIVKPLCMRFRPTHDPMLMYTIDIVNGYRGGLYGFFSAHAANTMSVAVFFCLVVRSRLLGATLILWSLLNGYTRIYLGVHYPSDVITGWIWGLIVALGCYFPYRYIYSKITAKQDYLSSQYTSTGYAITDIYGVILVLLVTLLYVIIRAMFPF